MALGGRTISTLYRLRRETRAQLDLARVKLRLNSNTAALAVAAEILAALVDPAGRRVTLVDVSGAVEKVVRLIRNGKYEDETTLARRVASKEL